MKNVDNYLTINNLYKFLWIFIKSIASIPCYFITSICTPLCPAVFVQEPVCHLLPWCWKCWSRNQWQYRLPQHSSSSCTECNTISAAGWCNANLIQSAVVRWWWEKREGMRAVFFKIQYHVSMIEHLTLNSTSREVSPLLLILLTAVLFQREGTHVILVDHVFIDGVTLAFQEISHPENIS